MRLTSAGKAPFSTLSLVLMMGPLHQSHLSLETIEQPISSFAGKAGALTTVTAENGEMNL